MSNASAERFEAHLRKTSERYWVTKTGEAVRPRDMSFGHLANTLRMIRRWGDYEKLDRELYCIGAAGSCNGDGAYDAVMSEANGYMNTSPHQFCMCEVPIYRTMHEEFSRRRMG